MTSFIHYSWEKLRDFVDAVLPALNAIMNIDFVISYPSIWTVLGLMPLWGKSSRQPAEGKCLGLKKVMRNSKTIVLLFHVLLRRGLIILWVLMNVWFTTATYLPIHSYCEFEITINHVCTCQYENGWGPECWKVNFLEYLGLGNLGCHSLSSLT